MVPFPVRAKEEEEAKQLVTDAKYLEKIGCFAIVLEKIPADLAKEVSRELKIPIIGIGAGNGVDGQVLVLHDMLGMTHEFNPRFLRRYLNLYDEINKAIKNYVDDVKNQDFPNENEEYWLPINEYLLILFNACSNRKVWIQKLS